MGTLRSIATVAAAALIAVGCAAMPEATLRSKLREAAGSVRGGDRAVVVPIHADSDMAAWTLRAELRSGESPLPHQLGNRMALGAKRNSVLVVGSGHDRLARAAVLGALADETHSLRGLTLVYVGNSKSAAALRPLARARDVRFLHRELP